MIVNIIARIYAMAIGFVIIWFINYYHSAAALGQLGLFLIFGHIIKTMGSFGLSQGIIYVDKSEIDINNNGLIKISLILVSGGIAVSIAAVALGFSSQDTYQTSALMILVAELVFIELSAAYLLLGNKVRQYGLFSYTVEPSVFLATLILLREQDIDLEIISTISFGVLSGVLAIYLIMTGSIPIRLAQRQGLARKVVNIYRHSLTYVVINVVQYVSLEADKLMLGAVLGLKELGIYLTLEKLSKLTLLVFNTLAPLTKKTFSTLRDTIPATQAYFAETRNLVIFASLPITFVLASAAREILGVFGEYQDYSLLLVLLVTIRSFQYATGYTAVLLQMSPLRNFDILSNIAKILLFGSGFIIFVWYFELGILGVVIASSLTVISIALLQIFFINQKYSVSVLPGIVYKIAPLYMFVLWGNTFSGWARIVPNVVTLGAIAWFIHLAWEQYKNMGSYGAPKIGADS